MTRHVLVPMDDSEQADDALEYALSEFDDARVTVLHVIDPIDAGLSARATLPGYSEEWYERAKADAETLFGEARAAAEERGVELTTHLEHGRPARSIIDYVESHDVDQVVMGSHGRSGVTRILLGSVAEAVVRRSPVPVTVVR